MVLNKGRKKSFVFINDEHQLTKLELYFQKEETGRDFIYMSMF